MQTSQWNSFQVPVSRDIGPKEYKWEAGISDANGHRAKVDGANDISCKMWADVPSAITNAEGQTGASAIMDIFHIIALKRSCLEG